MTSGKTNSSFRIHHLINSRAADVRGVLSEEHIVPQTPATPGAVPPRIPERRGFVTHDAPSPSLSTSGSSTFGKNALIYSNCRQPSAISPLKADK
jgi:hypothetical protein